MFSDIPPKLALCLSIYWLTACSSSEQTTSSLSQTLASSSSFLESSSSVSSSTASSVLASTDQIELIYPTPNSTIQGKILEGQSAVTGMIYTANGQPIQSHQGYSVSVNGHDASFENPQEAGFWRVNVPVQSGATELHIALTDPLGREAEFSYTVFTAEGDTSLSARAIYHFALDSQRQILYFIRNHKLCSLNLIDGQFSTLNTESIEDIESLIDKVMFDEVDQQLWIVARNGELVKMNALDGRVTRFSQSDQGVRRDVDQLAVDDQSGRLYAATMVTEVFDETSDPIRYFELVEINKDSGAQTVLFSARDSEFWEVNNNAQSLGFDSAREAILLLINGFQYQYHIARSEFEFVSNFNSENLDGYAPQINYDLEHGIVLSNVQFPPLGIYRENIHTGDVHNLIAPYLKSPTDFMAITQMIVDSTRQRLYLYDEEAYGIHITDYQGEVIKFIPIAEGQYSEKSNSPTPISKSTQIYMDYRLNAIFDIDIFSGEKTLVLSPIDYPDYKIDFPTQHLMSKDHQQIVLANIGVRQRQHERVVLFDLETKASTVLLTDNDIIASSLVNSSDYSVGILAFNADETKILLHIAADHSSQLVWLDTLSHELTLFHYYQTVANFSRLSAAGDALYSLSFESFFSGESDEWYAQIDMISVNDNTVKPMNTVALGQQNPFFTKYNFSVNIDNVTGKAYAFEWTRGDFVINLGNGSVHRFYEDDRYSWTYLGMVPGGQQTFEPEKQRYYSAYSVCDLVTERCVSPWVKPLVRKAH